MALAYHSSLETSTDYLHVVPFIVPLNLLMVGTGVSSLRRFISVCTSAFSVSNRVLTLCESDVLDGAMVVLAIYTLLITHPGILLVPEPQEYTKEVSS